MVPSYNTIREPSQKSHHLPNLIFFFKKENPPIGGGNQEFLAHKDEVIVFPKDDLAFHGDDPALIRPSPALEPGVGRGKKMTWSRRVSAAWGLSTQRFARSGARRGPSPEGWPLPVGWLNEVGEDGKKQRFAWVSDA